VAVIAFLDNIVVLGLYMDSESELRIVCVILGLYMVLDGLGSILVQPLQPFFWFQFVRLCRMIAGAVEIILGILL